MIEILGYRVLVKPDSSVYGDKRNEKGERVLDSGLLIVESDEVKREEASQIFGTIVGVGPLAWSDKGDGTKQVSVGDYVAYAKYGGTFITDPETKEVFVILNDLDITAKVSKGV